VQARFAGVGRPDEADLRGTFGAHDQRRSRATSTFLRSREFLGELLDAGLDVRLQMVRPLVLGDGPEHFAQAIETLLRFARLAVGFLRLLVFRCDVGRHASAILPECGVVRGGYRVSVRAEKAAGNAQNRACTGRPATRTGIGAYNAGMRNGSVL